MLIALQPLKSNIPLHSYRANLKPGAGYVTTFPYGGLSEFRRILFLCSALTMDEFTRAANQLIEMFKVVHVAQRLERTAIL